MRSLKLSSLIAGFAFLSYAAAQGPLDALPGWQYQGCVAIDFTIFTFGRVVVLTPNSPQICQAACRAAGFSLAYVQGDDCACSNTQPPVANLYADVGFINCFFSCSSNLTPDSKCGGIDLITFLGIYNGFRLLGSTTTTASVSGPSNTIRTTLTTTSTVSTSRPVVTATSTVTVVSTTRSGASTVTSTVTSATTLAGPSSSIASMTTWSNVTIPASVPLITETVYSTSTYTITSCPGHHGDCHEGEVTTACYPVATNRYPAKKYEYEECSTYVSVIDRCRAHDKDCHASDKKTCTDTYTRTTWYDDRKTYIKELENGRKTLAPMEPTTTGKGKPHPTHVGVAGEPAARDTGFMPLMITMVVMTIGMAVLL